MPELSLYNIDQISNDVRKQEITFSHLLDELIDHICCDVEHEMQNGFDFPEAYRRVKQKMGSRRLKEIQEETLYAVDTKYRQMKNTMKISGITGTILFGFAAIFKIMHWPGASILMVAGAVTLAFVFMPSALGVLWKETQSKKRIFLFITGFFAGALFILGTLLKIQHWPGANIVLTLSVLSGIFLFIPVLTVHLIRSTENKAKNPVYILGAFGAILLIAGLLFKILHWPLAAFLMMLGLLILVIIAFPWYTRIMWKEDKVVNPMFIFLVIGSMALLIPATMISLSLQRSYTDGYFINLEQEQSMYNYLFVNNQDILAKNQNSLDYASMNKLHSGTTDLLSVINGIEKKMIGASEAKKGESKLNPVQVTQTETGQKIDFELLKNYLDRESVEEFLMPGTASRQELENAMKTYGTSVAVLDSIPGIDKLLLLLDPAKYLPSDISLDGRITLVSGLHSTALLKNGILSFESSALKGIAKR